MIFVAGLTSELDVGAQKINPVLTRFVSDMVIRFFWLVTHSSYTFYILWLDEKTYAFLLNSFDSDDLTRENVTFPLIYTVYL